MGMNGFLAPCVFCAIDEVTWVFPQSVSHKSLDCCHWRMHIQMRAWKVEEEQEEEEEQNYREDVCVCVCEGEGDRVRAKERVSLHPWASNETPYADAEFFFLINLHLHEVMLNHFTWMNTSFAICTLDKGALFLFILKGERCWEIPIFLLHLPLRPSPAHASWRGDEVRRNKILTITTTSNTATATATCKHRASMMSESKKLLLLSTLFNLLSCCDLLHLPSRRCFHCLLSLSIMLTHVSLCMLALYNRLSCHWEYCVWISHFLLFTRPYVISFSFYVFVSRICHSQWWMLLIYSRKWGIHFDDGFIFTN